jgi:ABC-2 type transport system ATP-binding protein
MTGVSKSFGTLKAVNELNLSVEPGEIRGLLGPNGSGKSTTMKIIMGMLKPDSGSINVFGVDVRVKPVEAKRHIGYVPRTPFLYEYLSASEYRAREKQPSRYSSSPSSSFMGTTTTCSVDAHNLVCLPGSL